MKRACLVLSLLLCPAYAQQVYKCVENGKITFSDAPCGGRNARVSVVNARPNSIDSADGRAEIARDLYRRDLAKARRASASPRGGNDDYMATISKIKKEDECRNATSHYNTELSSIRNDQAAISAKKREMMSACGGGGYEATPRSNSSDYADPTPVPMPAPHPTPQPTIITNCDSSGCWDNMNGRYDKGAGRTYHGPSGACQMINGQMYCP